MKTILAVAILFAVTACELYPNGRPQGDDPYAGMIMANGGLLRPYQPPAPTYYQPSRPVTCYPAGYNVTCY